MVEMFSKKPGMDSRDNCGVCGKPLVYGTEEVKMKCGFCGQEYPAQIYCPEGHYVCDSCHRTESLDILRQVLASTKSADPIEIMELVMSHPSVPMHGPEHHSIVPAAIVTAVRNAGYDISDDAIEKAITRGAKVPGGWCGSHGACGSALGVGIAVSVLTGATPVKGKQRSLSNEATSFALSRLIDGNPRCCKRAGRRAVEAAVEFLKEKLDINLKSKQQIRCTYSARNRECVKQDCPYYSDK